MKTTHITNALISLRIISPFRGAKYLPEDEKTLAMKLTDRDLTPEARKDAAFKLAATGTESAIKTLIHMVEGKRFIRFNLIGYGDQILGIEALGESKSQLALKYLENLYQPKIAEKVTENYVMLGSDVYDTSTLDIYYDFPNAKGELKNLLKWYMWNVGGHYCRWEEAITEEQEDERRSLLSSEIDFETFLRIQIDSSSPPQSLKFIRRIDEPHCIIREAIFKLRAS